MSQPAARVNYRLRFRGRVAAAWHGLVVCSIMLARVHHVTLLLVSTLPLVACGGDDGGGMLGPPRADLVVRGPPGRSHHHAPPYMPSAIPAGLQIGGMGDGTDHAPDDRSSASASQSTPGSVTPATQVIYGKNPGGS
ncbi:hypothetical protein [Brytella acorum]|uniref:Uncharacterized protein n=1 Tax=Brytella acorum TaxID=2959299 RepID=A0AA35UZD2_9PROT|nr:hypothetical protein [Brytella acorum]MDF3623702.1 hypothetical protein [Brytella acorum]CAI9119880.1 hypothetical protein LMG32879_000706 [Brytella acorum]